MQIFLWEVHAKAQRSKARKGFLVRGVRGQRNLTEASFKKSKGSEECVI